MTHIEHIGDATLYLGGGVEASSAMSELAGTLPAPPHASERLSESEKDSQ
jgi:hypothetical protein